MMPKFLQPEVFPCASIEIVHVDNSITIVRAPVSRVERTIEETERAAFHTFLTDPTTGPLLDAMLADNAAIDAELARDDRDEDCGSECGPACGYCGRCS